MNDNEKSDSTSNSTQREVSFDEGLKLASKHGFTFFETSAKSDTNITVAFESLVKNIFMDIQGTKKSIPAVELAQPDDLETS